MIGWNSRQIIKGFIHRILFAKPRFRAFITTLVQPLDKVFADFTENRLYWQWKLYFTDQVVLLEHYLNDLYDLKGINSAGEIVRYSIATRESLIKDEDIISIDDDVFLPSNTMYYKVENAPGITVHYNSEIANYISEKKVDPNYQPPTPITRNQTYYHTQYNITRHFTVRIPSFMYSNLNGSEENNKASLEKELREEIGFYLKVGKQYKIDSYKN